MVVLVLTNTALPRDRDAEHARVLGATRLDDAIDALGVHPRRGEVRRGTELCSFELDVSGGHVVVGRHRAVAVSVPITPIRRLASLLRLLLRLEVRRRARERIDKEHVIKHLLALWRPILPSKIDAVLADLKADNLGAAVRAAHGGGNKPNGSGTHNRDALVRADIRPDTDLHPDRERLHAPRLGP